MKYILHAILVLALLFGVSAPVHDREIPTTSSGLDGLLTEFDSRVIQSLGESNAPGAALAIVKDDSIIYMRGFGLRKMGEADPIDVNTVFRIASLSKGFAAVLTGLLVRDSLLNWDDKVTNFLPEFRLRDPASTQNLTIRHLLSHTSGLVPNAFDNLIEANMPFEKIAGRLKEAHMVCSVGKCYSYQNVAFSLIDPIIESATGREYQDLVMERLFEPLGMYHSSLGKDGLTATGNFAHPHVRKKRRWSPTAVKDAYYSVEPAAGINASVYDMAQWLRALLGNRQDVVHQEIIQTVSAEQVATPDAIDRPHWNNHIRSAYYGLGWRIFDYEGRKLVFHGGAVRGYSSQIAFLPERNIGIVVLQNSWNTTSFVNDFLEMYLEL